jgi:hypothetical protein
MTVEKSVHFRCTISAKSAVCRRPEGLRRP